MEFRAIDNASSEMFLPRNRDSYFSRLPLDLHRYIDTLVKAEPKCVPSCRCSSCMTCVSIGARTLTMSVEVSYKMGYLSIIIGTSIHDLNADDSPKLQRIVIYQPHRVVESIQKIIRTLDSRTEEIKFNSTLGDLTVSIDPTRIRIRQETIPITCLCMGREVFVQLEKQLRMWMNCNIM